MGPEWCTDGVHGSPVTDVTASLPGPVLADCTFTEAGRRSKKCPFLFCVNTVCLQKTLKTFGPWDDDKHWVLRSARI